MRYWPLPAPMGIITAKISSAIQHGRKEMFGSGTHTHTYPQTHTHQSHMAAMHNVLAFRWIWCSPWAPVTPVAPAAPIAHSWPLNWNALKRLFCFYLSIFLMLLLFSCCFWPHSDCYPLIYELAALGWAGLGWAGLGCHFFFFLFLFIFFVLVFSFLFLCCVFWSLFSHRCSYCDSSWIIPGPINPINIWLIVL